MIKINHIQYTWFFKYIITQKSPFVDVYIIIYARKT